MTGERLYGMPGAEWMYDDPADVVKDFARDVDMGGYEVTIEEWSVHPPRYHLPTAEDVIDWATEYAAGNEVSEGYGHASDAAKHPSVTVAAGAFLDALAARITWREADRHVATLAGTVVVSGAGEADEPAWVRTEVER